MDSLEVLRFLCDVCGYRFFTGQPLSGHYKLFNYMHSAYMHYIPTLNSDVALNIAAGVSFSMLKAAVFITHSDLERLICVINRLDDIRYTNIVFITNEGVNLDFNKIVLSEFSAPFDEVVLSTTKHNVFIIKDGDLSA